MPVLTIVAAQHPADELPLIVLQIYRDFLKPGSESEFRKIEEDAAHICTNLKCPHPHLALESLSGSKEVWWLNAFHSAEQHQRVIDAYTANVELLEALAGISQRRQGLIGTSDDRITRYRADLSGGRTLKLAGARFMVATVTRGPTPAEAGAVFEAEDGTRFSLRPAHGMEEAEAVQATLGSMATMFAVRPYWGMPAEAWMASDPTFWQVNPMSNATG
jgi:hypothetical protein